MAEHLLCKVFYWMETQEFGKASSSNVLISRSLKALLVAYRGSERTSCFIQGVTLSLEGVTISVPNNRK